MWLLKVAWIFVLVCICQVECNNATGISTNVSAIAYHHCPNNQFCKAGSDPQPPGVLSCCRPCSCEADCYIGHHCCPDSGIDQTNNIPLTCKSMDEHFNKHRNIWYRFGRVTESYYVVDYCPDRYQDPEVIRGCMFPRSIRELVFVTDPRSTMIYKNYQCALCNGVTTYEFWATALVCLFTDLFYSIRNDTSSILELCSFNSVPTTSSTSPNAKWACHPADIDTCNVTGQWEAHDDVISDACATYNMPYTVETYSSFSGSIRGYQRYRNVYCYLCNTMVADIQANPVCKMARPPEDTKDSFFIPFEAVLDYELFDTVHEPRETKTQCNVNELEDIFSDKCARVICPFGRTPYFGRCISYMNDVNLTFTAIYEFTFTSSNSANRTVEEQPDEDMIDTLIQTLQQLLESKGCLYCRIGIASRFFVIQSIQNERCPNTIMLSIFKELTRVTSIRSGDRNEKFGVEIMISIRHSLVTDPNRIKIVSQDFARQLNGRRCAHAAQLSPKFYCKRIEFSVAELVDTGLGNGTIAMILGKSEPNKYVNGTVNKYVICVDDYISITNNGVKMDSIQIVFSVLFFWIFLKGDLLGF